MQSGFENKKKAMIAGGLGAVALLVVVYQFVPFFMGPSTPSSTQAAAPSPIVSQTRTPSARSVKGKAGKKVHVENLDPTLRLDLLAASEQMRYEGNGRNIFVSQPDVVIQKPIAPGATDAPTAEGPKYQTPTVAPPPPIPLKFYGFASSPGEPKKIFLKLNDDVFVAGEGEIVDRRYKVVKITNTFVEIQDVVNSGPPQNIPLTQG